MRILCSGRCHNAATSWPIQFVASRRVTSHTGGRLTATAAALQQASSAVACTSTAAAPSSPDASALASGRVTPGFAASAAFASLGASPSSWGALSAAPDECSSFASSALQSDASPEAAAASSEAAAPLCSCCASASASALDVRRERLRRSRGVPTCVTPRKAGSMCLDIPSSRARARFMLPSRRQRGRQRATGAGARLWRPMAADNVTTRQGGRASEGAWMIDDDARTRGVRSEQRASRTRRYSLKSSLNDS